MALLLTASPAGASRPPPTVTGAATDIGPTSAVLHGTVFPSDCPSGELPAFLYGPTDRYGETVYAPRVFPTGPTPVSVRVSGLTPATTYHVRLTATDTCGSTGQIDDVVFTTAPAPPSTAPPATDPAARAPVVSRVDASAVDGSSAVLGAVIDLRGCPDAHTNVRFGLRSDDDRSWPGPATEVDGHTTGTQIVRVRVASLLPAVRYRVQAAASNACGAATGIEGTFLTDGASGEPDPPWRAGLAALAIGTVGGAILVIRRRSRPSGVAADPTP